MISMNIIKIFGLILVGLIIYGNTLLNGFVADDYPQLVANTSVHSLANSKSLFFGSTATSGGKSSGLYYKPLMTATFGLLYGLFGPNALAYHLVQIILFISISVLLYAFFLRLLKNETLALVLAAVFLVHPINSEAALYISSYQDVLFLFFGLLGLLVSSPRGSSVLLLASLLSKETGVVMAAITTLYYILYRKNRLWVFLIYLTGAFVVYGYLRFGLAHIPISTSAVVPIASISLIERLMNIPAIIFSYLNTLFFPLHLAIDQQWVIRYLSFSNFTLPLLVDILFMAMLSVWLVILKKNHSQWLKPYIFFLLWFLAAFAFHLQLFPLDVTVSDRLFYLAFAGLLGLAGCFAMFLVSRVKNVNRYKYIIATLFIFSLIVLSVRTFIRTFDWRDGLTLCKRDLPLTPGNFILENSCGQEMLRLGKLDEATKHLERSIEIQPKWWASYNTLGIIYLLKEDLPRAESYYKQSIAQGQFYDAYVNLGLLYLKEKRYQDSIKILEEASRRFSMTPDILRALATAYYYTGQKEKAVSAAEHLVKLSPTAQNQQLYRLIRENSR